MHQLELSAADAAEVHRFVARRVGNFADAADIAQQALLLAWAKLGTCRGENVSAWLLTIARHLIVDHYRAQNRVQFVEVAALAEKEPSLQTLPDALLAACECRARLRTWLDCITQRLRLEEQVAVLLADVYGHRDKDSAAVLRMSTPSFKLLLHGARTRLQEIAGGECILVRKTRADACAGSGNGQTCTHAQCSGGRPCAQPTHRLGVICGLGSGQLVALRGRLVAGLKSAGLGLATGSGTASGPGSGNHRQLWR